MDNDIARVTLFGTIVEALNRLLAEPDGPAVVQGFARDELSLLVTRDGIEVVRVRGGEGPSDN